MRAVGARVSREMLKELPKVRSELEPVVNRSLSTLDWGWVAILEGKDTMIFEHRTPWPFEKRPDELCLLLEGFYSETLHRLGHDAAMQVRLIGRRGGAVVFQWLPPDRLPEKFGEPPAPRVTQLQPMPSSDLRADPDALTSGRTQNEVFAALEQMRSHPAAKGPEAKSLAPEAPIQDMARTEPSFTLPPAPRPRIVETAAPAQAPASQTYVAPTPSVRRMPMKRARPDSISALLAAATVFVLLSALGLLTNGGDMVVRALHSISHLVLSDGSGSISAVERHARSGDRESQIQLALRLAGGQDAAPDYDDAADWLKLAASEGSPEAEYDLGVMTENGLGVKRDDVEASILYLKAAGGGFPPAEYRMGAAYESGAGVVRNDADAAVWYERAARHGVVAAQSALGRLFARGGGVTADPALAYAWFRLAERGGDREAASERARLMTKLSLQQLASAQKMADALVTELDAAHGTSVAAKRPTMDELVPRESRS